MPKHHRALTPPHRADSKGPPGPICWTARRDAAKMMAITLPDHPPPAVVIGAQDTCQTERSMPTRQPLPSRNAPRLPWRSRGSRRFRIALLVLALALAGLSSVGPAARTTEPEPKPADAPAPLFLAQHCKGCHAGDRPKGNFRLDSLTQ